MRFALVPSYARTMVWLLKFFCDVDIRVEGAETLPDGPCVVLLKHSSIWETLTQLMVFPRQVIVLKRELMWIPILGWALASMKSISINRKAGRSAVKQVMEQGKQRLAEGTWVMIFPEGTRVPKGRMGRWGHSGTLLAVEAGVPVIPVAHNAADHWPNDQLTKTPGTITMRIGPTIQTRGRTADDVAHEARAWMDQAMVELSPQHVATLPDGSLVPAEPN
jgi:1-acyl-sn-glycerol-3-phosphate acyltransferase